MSKIYFNSVHFSLSSLPMHRLYSRPIESESWEVRLRNQHFFKAFHLSPTLVAKDENQYSIHNLEWYFQNINHTLSLSCCKTFIGLPVCLEWTPCSFLWPTRSSKVWSLLTTLTSSISSPFVLILQPYWLASSPSGTPNSSPSPRLALTVSVFPSWTANIEVPALVRGENSPGCTREEGKHKNTE